MLIDAATKLCCLIGYPVVHSVSPQMHNAAFKALGLNYVYLAFEVTKEELGDAVKGLKALGAAGFNVTIPHKVAVMKYLDRLDESAEEAGAVNAVVFRKETLVGYNTDVHGIMEALEKTDLPKDRPALIIGAGGAARAAAAALIKLGFDQMIVANRTVERGRQLADWIRSKGRQACFRELWQLSSITESCGMIINATSVGMYPKIDETLLSSGDIPEDAVVLDMVYNPPKTKLLQEAEKAGAETISGVEVLVHQGAKAFELWTGQKPPVDVMRKAALTALEGENDEDQS